jgi:hypothetical protein
LGGKGLTVDNQQDSGSADGDRRASLQNAGRLAVVAPPVMGLLLSTSMSSPAIALSGGGDPGAQGHGNT